MDNEEKNFVKASNILTGTGLFMFFIIYINLRSSHIMNLVDWGIVILAGIIFCYGLIKLFKAKMINTNIQKQGTKIKRTDVLFLLGTLSIIISIYQFIKSSFPEAYLSILYSAAFITGGLTYRLRTKNS